MTAAYPTETWNASQIRFVADRNVDETDGDEFTEHDLTTPINEQRWNIDD